MNTINNKNKMNRYFDENQLKYLDENSSNVQCATPRIFPLRPDIGIYVKVNGLNIPEQLFEDEFEKITDAYFSVIKKLNTYYKFKINLNKIIEDV